ncbi:MAG: hypothetical protein LC098_02745 [Burkholderiales bacterium]|nr:hypothetical protein [Burkholderiales bacterium]
MRSFATKPEFRNAFTGYEAHPDRAQGPARGGRHIVAGLAATLMLGAADSGGAIDSRAYYVFFLPSDAAVRAMGVTSTRPIKEVVPWLRMTGDGPQPGRLGDGFTTSDRGFRAFAPQMHGIDSAAGTIDLYGYRDGTCNGRIRMPLPALGTRQTSQTRWLIDPVALVDPGDPECNMFVPPPNLPTPTTTDELTFSPPKRRKALDGGEYDASELVHVRNGVPSPRNNFELSSLPPPWVEDEVVEYVNRVQFPAQPDGQYFYTAITADKAILDAYPALWQRTGRSFKSGGYVGTCRFYGGRNGGPNTHFYTADAKECDALKKIDFLDYEGSSFTANMPLPGAAVEGIKRCPIDSKPLFRLYNDAARSNGRFVSNHRYTTDRADVAAFVARGWVDEGQVMCVPL